jgi:predicted dienelactone hydrolase
MLVSEYNPYTRGPHPVGTRQFSWTDTERNHSLPVDVWYPATKAYEGKDLDPETQDRYEMVPGMGEAVQQAVKDAEAESGQRALVVFSHGFGGERRQTTFLCCHLASHGYVVAAMDHVGNTTADMFSGEGAAGDPEVIERFVQSRPCDVSFVIDQMLAGQSGLEIIPEQIGMSGHSFGGWTTLKTLETDERIRAALPLAPAGGFTALDADNVMAKSLDFTWRREVPVLYIVAELDSILPLEGMQDMFDRNPEPKTTVVLLNADHFHFNDAIEQTHDGYKLMLGMLTEGMDEDARHSTETMIAGMKPSSELVAGADAYALINGLGLAHFDRELRGNQDAASFLSGDLVATLAERDINVKTF